ncbi:MAG: hypothetical protein OXC40_06250 [Proteobacteria bacterium]|nr:hypothetical protein [Pseudomonadota bacterium]
MSDSFQYIRQIFADSQSYHQKQAMVLSFWQYLDLIKTDPHRPLRHSSRYLLDMFDYYGTRDTGKLAGAHQRYKLFDYANNSRVAVIGGEKGQKDIVDTLRSFDTLGGSFKLILLHGPNGSSKSTTISSIAGAMEDYSHTSDGALYKFSWIFPKNKELGTPKLGQSQAIGFTAGSETTNTHPMSSLAGLAEGKIATKIHSEFRENPIYLLPMPFRETLLGQIAPDTKIPGHILLNGLSKKNHDIFESLYSAYHGDLFRVLHHIQVERFYLSRHYRCGIATVEPQMSVDAKERQITVDRYLKDLPAVLQTINFFEYSGELVDANRGMIEFSDFLKRPLETFKYLLNTVEISTVHLGSANAHLDTVFIATTNDKHWEAFAQIPDFNSFRGRIHLITVPYLIQVNQEMDIYKKDIQLLQAQTIVAPYTLKILCLFAVMTRLRPPGDKGINPLHLSDIQGMNVLQKSYLYNEELGVLGIEKKIFDVFSKNSKKLIKQYDEESYYEGKFGASPRLIRDILHQANQNCQKQHLTAIDILNELEKIIERTDLYEFLRMKPQGSYHNPKKILQLLQGEYCRIFENELLDSMTMATAKEYEKLLTDYIHHVVHFLRKEKFFDKKSQSYEEASESFMAHIEKMLAVTSHQGSYRESLLARMGAWKVEHPDENLDLTIVFHDLLNKIKKSFYASRKEKITEFVDHILKAHFHKDTSHQLTELEAEEVRTTLEYLEKNYGYHTEATVRSLRFCLAYSDSGLTQKKS